MKVCSVWNLRPWLLEPSETNPYYPMLMRSVKISVNSGMNGTRLYRSLSHRLRRDRVDWLLLKC